MSEWEKIRKLVCDIEDCMAEEATNETTEAAIELLDAVFRQQLTDSLDRHKRYIAKMGEATKLRNALADLQAFVSVMIGVGPDAEFPETIDTPLGVPVKIGVIMRDVAAALSGSRDK